MSSLPASPVHVISTPASFGWKDIASLVAALFVLGAGWLASHQTAAIAAVGIAVVWGVNWVAKKYNYHIGKGWLTGILAALSLILSFFFRPLNVAPIPALCDSLCWQAYLPVLFAAAAAQVGFATAVYNALLASIGDKLGTLISG